MSHNIYNDGVKDCMFVDETGNAPTMNLPRIISTGDGPSVDGLLGQVLANHSN